MAKKSKRPEHHDEHIELNLNPMMDLFAVLIPALLMMSAVVEVTVLNVSAPAIGGSDSAPPPTPTKPPLNLTIQVSPIGFIVSGAGGVFAGNGVEPSPPPPGNLPTLPLVQKPIHCSRFRGTRPPPREKNAAEAACTREDRERSFWQYDLAGLAKKVVQLKDAYPDERRAVIQAFASVEYEVIINVMDAIRDVREPGKPEARVLFDEVVLSPAAS